MSGFCCDIQSALDYIFAISGGSLFALTLLDVSIADSLKIGLIGLLVRALYDFLKSYLINSKQVVEDTPRDTYRDD